MDMVIGLVIAAAVGWFVSVDAERFEVDGRKVGLFGAAITAAPLSDQAGDARAGGRQQQFVDQSSAHEGLRGRRARRGPPGAGAGSGTVRPGAGGPSRS